MRLPLSFSMISTLPFCHTPTQLHNSGAGRSQAQRRVTGSRGRGWTSGLAHKENQTWAAGGRRAQPTCTQPVAVLAHVVPEACAKIDACSNGRTRAERSGARRRRAVLGWRQRRRQTGIRSVGGRIGNRPRPDSAGARCCRRGGQAGGPAAGLRHVGSLMARAEVPAASVISPMALPLLEGAIAIGRSPWARRGD